MSYDVFCLEASHLDDVTTYTAKFTCMLLHRSLGKFAYVYLADFLLNSPIFLHKLWQWCIKFAKNILRTCIPMHLPYFLLVKLT